MRLNSLVKMAIPAQGPEEQTHRHFDPLANLLSPDTEMRTPPPLPNAKTRTSGRTKGCLGCLGITVVAFIGILLVPNLSRPTRKEGQRVSEIDRTKTETVPKAAEKRTTAEKQNHATLPVADQKTQAKGKKQQQVEQDQPATRKTGLDVKTEKFKQWALQNTAVTDIAINSRTMFVTLKPEKYTNRDNVRVIAETLARYYANQVGIDYAVCHVFLGNDEYAKGTFRR